MLHADSARNRLVGIGLVSLTYLLFTLLDGSAKWLVQTVQEDPRLAVVRRWLLATADAHDLYRRYGWEDAPAGGYMHRRRP